MERERKSKQKETQVTDLQGKPIIEDPLPGTIVEHSGWSPTKKLPGYPCDVYILHGHYLVEGRISNFWYWRKVTSDKKGNISLGPEESGYGSFHPSKHKYNIEIKISLKK